MKAVSGVVDRPGVVGEISGDCARVKVGEDEESDLKWPVGNQLALHCRHVTRLGHGVRGGRLVPLDSAAVGTVRRAVDWSCRTEGEVFVGHLGAVRKRWIIAMLIWVARVGECAARHETLPRAIEVTALTAVVSLVTIDE